MSIEKARKDEVVRLLRKVFEKYDVNEDEILSREEIDEAVATGGLSSMEAQIVALFKDKYQAIKDLHRDGWFRNRKGISLADLLVLEEILRADSLDELDTEKLELYAVAHEIMGRVNKVARAKRRLYLDPDKPQGSIKPIAVRQGQVGDCVFLASLASVAACNPSIIASCIEDNGDRTYTVTFPGARQTPVTVEEPNLVELALYARFTRLGIWPCVMEKAYGTLLYELNHDRSPIPQENAEGAQQVIGILDLLTGESGQWYLVSRVEEDRFRAVVESAHAEKRSMVAGSNGIFDTSTLDGGLISGHAFSVIDWDSDRDLLVLRDPWGEDHKEDRFKDGVFSIDLKRFRRNFVGLYVEEWRSDSRFIDKPRAGRKAIIRPKP
ncbi:MAG: C2 family cysteine protease [Candidatus Obscuribacterales bacterium]